MGGGDDGARGFPLSAYCCISLRPPRPRSAIQKLLSRAKIYTSSIPKNRMAKRLNGSVTARNRCGGARSMGLSYAASVKSV
jgi:hypothetical protein